MVFSFGFLAGWGSDRPLSRDDLSLGGGGFLRLFVSGDDGW